jgi:hypothetical protein
MPLASFLLIYAWMEHLRAKENGGRRAKLLAKEGREACREKSRRAKEGALAYPEDTSYLAYEYASAYV